MICFLTQAGHFRKLVHTGEFEYDYLESTQSRLKIEQVKSSFVRETWHFAHYTLNHCWSQVWGNNPAIVLHYSVVPGYMFEIPRANVTFNSVVFPVKGRNYVPLEIY